MTVPSGNQSDYVTVVHPGDAAVSVVGTPFYLAFKGVTCAVSALIAVPVAGISAASESHFAPKIRDGLGEVGGGEVAPEGDRSLAVGGLLLVVEVVARDRLAGEGGEKDDEEEERQRVVAEEACQARA